jgi:N utilization substance protein B
MYAWYSSEVRDLEKGEKELYRNIDKMTEAYVLSLKLLDDLVHYSHLYADDQDAKMMATIQNRKETRKFGGNLYAIYLCENNEYNQLLKRFKIKNQLLEPDMLRKVYGELVKTEEYQKYIGSPEHQLTEDMDMMLYLYKQLVQKSEYVSSFMEEKSMYWESDQDLVGSAVIKTIKEIFKSKDQFRLISISKDWDEDWHFALTLFRKSIVNDEQYSAMIQERTSHWDVDRIAQVDILLIKMAIAELAHAESIPVKVTINEYIELAKDYSTPKSNIFVNGLLDSISKEMMEKGMIQKAGRGLLE